MKLRSFQNRTVRNLLLAAGLLAGSLGASEASAGLKFGVHGSGSYTIPTVSGGGTRPLLLGFGGGVSLGVPLGQKFQVGVMSTYTLFNQYSDPDSTVGNMRGTRWDLAAPFVAINFGKTMLRLNAQFLGAYTFGNTTATGSTLSYKGPLGGRGELLFGLGTKLSLGVFGEYVMFSTQSDSTAGDATLTDKFTVLQAGLGLNFALF